MQMLPNIKISSQIKIPVPLSRYFLRPLKPLRSFGITRSTFHYSSALSSSLSLLPPSFLRSLPLSRLSPRKDKKKTGTIIHHPSSYSLSPSLSPSCSKGAFHEQIMFTYSLSGSSIRRDPPPLRYTCPVAILIMGGCETRPCISARVAL